MTTINLTKGGNINLSKTVPNLSLFHVGLGWDAKVTDSGDDFDLDVSAFMLKGEATERKLPSDKYFIFFNNMISPDGAVVLSEDNRTGKGDGDDESTIIDLNKMSPEIQEISFIVSIYEAETRRQNFGQVSNAFIRIVDKLTNQEIARYDLTEDFSTETSVQFGSLYLHNGEWKFKAIGAGYNKGLGAFVDMYSA
jgi:tellurium resistance protein TerD